MRMRSERPTILQIIPELDTGGAELSTIEIAGAIVDAGGRALVVSEGGRMASRIEAAGGEFIPFSAATKNPLKILNNARRLKHILKAENVDLVHARSRAPAWSGYLAAKRTTTPFLATYHGVYSETNALKKRYNKVMASGELVIANSMYTSKLVQSRYGIPESKLRVIYRGLDGARYDPDVVTEERREALRSAWGVAPGNRIIILVARLTAWKGQLYVVEAVNELSKRGKLDNTKVVFAGDAQGRDSYVDQLNAKIREGGLSQTISMVGHVEDVPAALSLAHTALVPSVRPEAFGRTAIEAQAMACPVIATNIGAPPETVLAVPSVEKAERTGWLVPSDDGIALADALEESLALSDEERQHMGGRARRHVLQNFSLENMRRRTLHVYDEILGSQLVKTWSAR